MALVLSIPFVYPLHLMAQDWWGSRYFCQHSVAVFGKDSYKDKSRRNVVLAIASSSGYHVRDNLTGRYRQHLDSSVCTTFHGTFPPGRQTEVPLLSTSCPGRIILMWYALRGNTDTTTRVQRGVILTLSWLQVAY
ncbi:hypothetical protein GDO78_018118 [Eleutherodactylus coqui]|uniref:Secreted protein n=1 Tax=Eleutherodactylus coqui TaxID=57060 RepID=A0A8J6ECM7_ELECQ|nr:hypothetical protein GDO78_018118 [Eleutherodactylus coqui]